ncbi:hypothetical protein [Metabacillus idriensis]|uniref:hypothetical protein n=1 Tax=Metabacillus idriensis TaxID=324768 RepID=UPI00174D035C|nr:hypothetical protein [Metabacillus idriensis]
MKKSILIICIIFTSSMILTGCIKLKTLEVESESYKSFGNELSYYGIGLGETRKVVHDKLGDPDRVEDSRYIYEEEKLALEFDRSRILTSLSSKDSGYKTKERVKVGDDKSRLLKKYEDFDLYELATNEGSVIYFLNRTQNVFFYLGSDQKVQEIIQTNPELSLIDAFDFFDSFTLDESLKKLDDEEVIKSSKPVNLDFGFESNKQKLLSDDFLEYAKAGLFPFVPVPMDMSEEDLTFKYGSPSLIDEEDDYRWYFYKKMKTFFGMNEDGEIKQIKAYVNVTREEIESKFDVKEEGKRLYISLPDDYPVTVYVQFTNEDSHYLIMEEKE